MKDPTYKMDEIEGDGVWHIAFILSELWNHSAPIGWGKFIPLAEGVSEAAREAIRQ
jgi:hypothetical protein